MKSLYDYIKETIVTPMNTMGAGDVTTSEPLPLIVKNRQKVKSTRISNKKRLD